MELMTGLATTIALSKVESLIGIIDRRAPDGARSTVQNERDTNETQTIPSVG